MGCHNGGRVWWRGVRSDGGVLGLCLWLGLYMVVVTDWSEGEFTLGVGAGFIALNSYDSGGGCFLGGRVQCR